MYQRQEIIVKKNVQLMARYADALEQSMDAGMSGTEEEQFMKSRFTEAEMGMIRATENVHAFLDVMVQYYLDILGLFEKFSYDSHGEPQPYVTCKTDRQENEDEIRIVIEEFWNNDFEQSCTNPLMEDGFKGWVDYDHVPKVVRFLYNGIAQHEFLQKEYAEHRELFGECLIYNCIARYFDEVSNGEGAIGIFDHETNRFDVYGYGAACNGWSGDILTDHFADRAMLEQQPDKLWYATNPMICWRPIGSVNAENYAETEYGEDIQRLLDAIGEEYFLNCLDGGCFEYDDGTWNGDEIEFYFLKDGRDDELTPYTSLEILELLNRIEKANRIFIEVQKKSCQRNGLDAADFVNQGFTCGLLFYSHEGEILFAEAAGEDESGMKNGEIVLHCRKF